jgi:choline dehydrogenase-like flavoprotein
VGRVKNGFGDKPSVRYTHTRRDMEKMRQAAHLIAQMHVAAGARAVIPAIYGLPYRLKPDEIDLIKEGPLDPRCYTAILSHLFGGCIMGVDPNRSVCDPNGHVHGYQGLVVADASTIPTTLGINPQHTIMALARVKAERLLS